MGFQMRISLNFCIKSTFKSLCDPPPPFAMKSDIFILQFDGKHEDCLTLNKIIKHIVFTRHVILIEFWSIVLYGVVVIFAIIALSSSHHCTGVKRPSFKSMTRCRDYRLCTWLESKHSTGIGRLFFFTPPLPTVPIHPISPLMY